MLSLRIIAPFVLGCLTAESSSWGDLEPSEKEPIGALAILGGGAMVSAVALTVLQSSLAPHSCRICSANSWEKGTRNSLRWSHPKSAKWISDGLLYSVPVGAMALAYWGNEAANQSQALTDVLLVLEAVSLAGLGTQIVKLTAARSRPFAVYKTGTYPEGTDDHLSFWSGHTAITMAAGTSLGMIQHHRGRADWPYYFASGVALSLTTGYLRIAADKHWLGDVISGAAWGTLCGLAVPILHLRLKTTLETENAVHVLVTPAGIVGTY